MLKFESTSGVCTYLHDDRNNYNHLGGSCPSMHRFSLAFGSYGFKESGESLTGVKRQACLWSLFERYLWRERDTQSALEDLEES